MDKFNLDFESRDGAARAVFAKLKHVQSGDWLTPEGFGFSTAQHNFRDYINVVIGRFKYGVNCHTISGGEAVRKKSFPMTLAAQASKKVIREHSIPSKVLWGLAQKSNSWQDCLVLFDLFTIVILSRDEDRMITHQSSMPEGWQVGDCVYARYRDLPFFDELIQSRIDHPAEADYIRNYL